MRRATQIGSAIATERALSLADKFIDAAMIISLILWGPLACFIVGMLLSLPFAAGVLEYELRTKGTGVEHLKDWALSPDEPIEHSPHQPVRMFRTMLHLVGIRLKATLRWMMCSYWAMLLIGSVVYLESDYVTLLLKKEGETRRSVYLRVLFPAVTWGIIGWTLIYWGLLEGSLAAWVWLVGCEPTKCLAEPEWQPVLEALRHVERIFYSLLANF